MNKQFNIIKNPVGSISTPMPKIKPLKQEENEDLSVDTKDKK